MPFIMVYSFTIIEQFRSVNGIMFSKIKFFNYFIFRNLLENFFLQL